MSTIPVMPSHAEMVTSLVGHRLDVRALFKLAVVLAVLASAGIFIAWLRGTRDSAVSAGARGGEKSLTIRTLAHPLLQFGLTCLLLWVNQVIFNAYVVNVHGGDPTFVKRWLGPGWCALDPNSVAVRWAGAALFHGGGDHPILALSVLRVQAFLELPFTIFAYLAVTRLLSPSLARWLSRLPVVFVAAVSFTLPLSLAEIALANPWTGHDLVIRAVAALTVPLYVAWLGRLAGPSEGEAKSALGLVVFLLGAGAIAVLVLIAYDAFLLYNLGHLGWRGPTIVGSVFVAVLASSVLPWVASHGTSGSASGIHRGLVAFTAIFYAASLPIRYAAAYDVASIAGALLVIAALLTTAVRVAESADRFRALASLTVGLFVAIAVAALALPYVGGGELALAQVALALLITWIVVARLVELALGARTVSDSKVMEEK